MCVLGEIRCLGHCTVPQTARLRLDYHHKTQVFLTLQLHAVVKASDVEEARAHHVVRGTRMHHLRHPQIDSRPKKCHIHTLRESCAVHDIAHRFAAAVRRLQSIPRLFHPNSATRITRWDLLGIYFGRGSKSHGFTHEIYNTHACRIAHRRCIAL